MLKISLNKKHEISPYIYMQFLEPLSSADPSVDIAWDYINDCWKPMLLEKLTELNPTMIRFGGCFASYYHWKEGVGPREKRPWMINLHWDGVYSNQVGTDELVDLCRHTNAEPLVVVNTESDGRMEWAYPKPGMDRFGTSEEAAEWIDYCNNPDNKLRKSHGIDKPYNIKWWQIGNETNYGYVPTYYGKDRMTDRTLCHGYNLDKAAEVTYRFAKEMHKADPSVNLIAWGDPKNKETENWATKMCETSGEYISHIAFHHHFGSGLPDSPLRGTDYRNDPDLTWHHLLNACHSLDEKLTMLKEDIKPYGKRLAMTEGHFGVPGRNRNEVLSTWGAGVAYARLLNVIERHTDVLDIATMADFFGNRWQVNAIMLYTQGDTRNAYLQPVGRVMSLFRHHIGKYALDVDFGEGIDATASLSEDGKKVFVHMANLNRTLAKNVEIKIDGKEIKKITAYEVACDSTTEITNLNPDVFNPVTSEVKGNTYTIGSAGVSALEIEID